MRLYSGIQAGAGDDNSRGTTTAHDQRSRTCSGVPLLLEMPTTRRDNGCREEWQTAANDGGRRDAGDGSSADGGNGCQHGVTTAVKRRVVARIRRPMVIRGWAAVTDL
ncbi:hypothetical protein BHE74_00016213 [Ensete ventricosum]|nr:hypothetical protein GW17_00059996 [Ensete ventricosum]RWW75754.1 hypothetical protein BHE74_00016213 [Ensete ventricosum]